MLCQVKVDSACVETRHELADIRRVCRVDLWFSIVQGGAARVTKIRHGGAGSRESSHISAPGESRAEVKSAVCPVYYGICCQAACDGGDGTCLCHTSDRPSTVRQWVVGMGRPRPVCVRADHDVTSPGLTADQERAA